MASRTVRARWVMPRAGTIWRGGWVQAADGLVTDLGERVAAGTSVDLGDVIVLPGLVNAHTHLELSWLAGKVPPAASMDGWLREMMHLRRLGPPGGDVEVLAAMDTALASARASGTVLIGDVSNTLLSASRLHRAGMAGTLFHEILGFRPVDVHGMVHQARERLTAALADAAPLLGAVVAHAPYSTAPSLFREIARTHEGPAPLAVHIAESMEEMALLRDGTGPFRALLERLEVWDEAWTPPGAAPIQFLHAQGYLNAGTLLVHGVHLTPDDLDAVRRAECVLVTCPRSNTWVGGGVPPVARFYASGVDVAIGTDSLASVDSLNLFDELAALRRLAPEVEAARLIDSATRVGAQALGWGRTFGALAPGMSSCAAVVRVPAHLGDPRDVEEYLVSGVPAEAVSLLDLAAA
ncbi:MAG: cytosine deaminase [Acidimicrobiia bacterium]